MRCVIIDKHNAIVGLCDLSDIKSVGSVRMCTITDISAMVTSIGMKICIMVHIGLGLALFGGGTPKGSPKSKILARLKSEYLENDKSQRYMSIRA